MLALQQAPSWHRAQGTCNARPLSVLTYTYSRCGNCYCNSTPDVGCAAQAIYGALHVVWPSQCQYMLSHRTSDPVASMLSRLPTSQAAQTTPLAVTGKYTYGVEENTRLPYLAMHPLAEPPIEEAEHAPAPTHLPAQDYCNYSSGTLGYWLSTG